MSRFVYIKNGAGEFDGEFGEFDVAANHAIVNRTFIIPLSGQMIGESIRVKSLFSLGQNPAYSTIEYDSSKTDISNPIITLAEDVSSWEEGDEIAIGSTDFNQDHTEKFKLLKCPKCQPNQVKLNKKAIYNHWGRIDTRSGIDQRAPVGLLTRNVKIEGEVGKSKFCFKKDPYLLYIKNANMHGLVTLQRMKTQ